MFVEVTALVIESHMHLTAAQEQSKLCAPDSGLENQPDATRKIQVRCS